MQRSSTLLLSLAILSAAAATALAQNATSANPEGPSASSNYIQSQTAPIERAAPSNSNDYSPSEGQNAGQEEPGYRTPGPQRPGIKSSQPLPGVFLRVAPKGSVSTVSSGADRTELRVERGRANIVVLHPAGNPQILIDLPGGQVALVQDGLYTFNGDTNTVGVVHGEADAFAGQSDNEIKVKENHQLVLNGATARPIEIDPAQLRNDLLPNTYARNGQSGYGGTYGDGFYRDGPYGYPYGAYGYYPYWGYGYPFGFGFGYGWGGGWGYRGYGYRGGYGYHGGGYGGHAGGFGRGGHAGGGHR